MVDLALHVPEFIFKEVPILLMCKATVALSSFPSKLVSVQSAARAHHFSQQWHQHVSVQ